MVWPVSGPGWPIAGAILRHSGAVLVPSAAAKPFSGVGLLISAVVFPLSAAEDGGPLGAGDAAGFEVYATTNLFNTNAWVRLTNSLSLSNGLLHLEEPAAAGLPRARTLRPNAASEADAESF